MLNITKAEKQNLGVEVTVECSECKTQRILFYDLSQYQEILALPEKDRWAAFKTVVVEEITALSSTSFVPVNEKIDVTSELVVEQNKK